MQKVLDSTPARQFLGLEPIPHADEVIKHAKATGQMAEAEAKAQRDSVKNVLRKGAFITAAVIAPFTSTVQHGATDVVHVAHSGIEHVVDGINGRLNSDPAVRGIDNTKPDRQ